VHIYIQLFIQGQLQALGDGIHIAGDNLYNGATTLERPDNYKSSPYLALQACHLSFKSPPNSSTSHPFFDFLCLVVFYVGHVDKISLYATVFHCNTLSKHHHHIIPRSNIRISRFLLKPPFIPSNSPQIIPFLKPFNPF
jgi:hypothetical protein